MSARAGEASGAAGPRVLGFWMCTALVVGNIIGIGIFTMPADLAPYGLNALTGWLVNVVGCTLLALSFSSLARAFPGMMAPPRTPRAPLARARRSS